MSKSHYSHLTAAQEMPRRLAACLAGVPVICDHRECRREGRCVGDGVPCFARHQARIVHYLETAAERETASTCGDHPRG